MSLEERLKKLLEASPEQLQAIDDILAFGVHQKAADIASPLLLEMKSAAKYMGVSRTTLWRMIKIGFLQRIEILPGSFRLRRADLHEIASGRRKLFPDQ